MLSEFQVDLLAAAGLGAFSVTPWGKKVWKALSTSDRDRRIEAAYNFNPPNEQGSASFATEKLCKKAGLLGSKGIPIAALNGRTLRYDADAMLITVAPVGSGKGTSQIIPAILSLDDRSLVVFDPKGENVAVTGHYRKRLGPVYVLNPYEILMPYLKGLKMARFNPMARLIDPKEPPLRFGPLAAKLANSIVWHETQNSETEHFSASAEQLLQGLIMAVARHSPAKDKTLVRVAEIVSTGETFGFSSKMMKTSPDVFIRQKLGRFAAPGADESKELNGINSTAVTQGGFLGDVGIANCISGSDFRFSDLREQVCTVYVVLPLDFLEVAGKFFRLIVSSALGDLLQPGRGKKRVLLIMDEFFQYGALSAVENAFGMARGFGVQLWPILQDLSQLEGRYPRTFETFLSNAGVRTFMTPQDEKTAKYVSEQAGITSVFSYSHNVSIDRRTKEPQAGHGTSVVTRPLIHPHEARELPQDKMYVWVRGVDGVIKAEKRAYFNSREFAGKYRPNPYFKEKGFFKKLLG